MPRWLGALVLPLAIYSLFAALLTWPLILHPFSRLGALRGPGDPYLNLWILGWDLQTLSEAPLRLLDGRAFDANIFHPARQSLAYSDHLLVVSLLAWPVYALSESLVFTYNAVLVGSLVASALAMHAFVRSVTGSWWGAMAAGTVWGFWPYHFAHLPHLQLQALYLLPLAFLFLHRLVAGQRWRDAVGLGLMLGLQTATSVYYGVIGGLAIVVSAAALAVAVGGRHLRRLVVRLALSGVVAFLVAAPFVWPYFQVQQREGFTRTLYDASRHAAIPASYVSVPAVNWIYGASGWLTTSRGVESELFPGFVVSALAVAGVFLGRRQGSWALVLSSLAVIAVGALLSLGPDGLRPLYAWLHRTVLGFQAIRAPARFGVLVAFGLATLAALAVRALEPRVSATRALDGSGPALLRMGALPVLLCLLVLEYANAIPLAWAEAPRPSAVGVWLRDAPAPGAVLYLPLRIDIESTPHMVDSLTHLRPIVNGYSGQRPAFYAALVDTMSQFPSVDAMWTLKELDVRYVVTPDPVDTSIWPLVERARLPTPGGPGIVYELAWSEEVEARLGEAPTPAPPPPGLPPFDVGEAIDFTVTWDSPAGAVVAGAVRLAVAKPEGSEPGSNASATWRFEVVARTAPWMARFFEANDRFVTVTDHQLLPLVHERHLREGRRIVDERLVFDLDARTVQRQTSGEVPSGPALRVWPGAREAVSVLYYVRTLDLSPGKRVDLPIVENGRNGTLSVAVAGLERIDVGGRSVEALRLDATLQRVQRRSAGSMTLWLTADDRREPVAARVNAAFGQVRLERTGWSSREPPATSRQPPASGRITLTVYLGAV